jgi:predicted MPP superfamily phosphohydrolase
VPALTRRRFVQKLTAATFALGSSTASYSAGWERRRPILVESTLPCPHLKESQHGIKILHLSDLHADDWTPTIAIERAVRLANAAQPDLIVFTGDYITSKPDLFLPAARALSSLHAPLGIFACMGNHDVWHGPRIAPDLRQLGIRPLINESVRVQAPGGPLWITGLDSAWGGRPDLRAALGQWKRNEPNLILFHEPDAVIRLAAQANLAAVQLSGHTHGGQVCAPFIGAIAKPYLGRKYTLGYHRVADMHLYVNPGLGTMNLPFRFLCRPEVTLHTLVPA